GCCSMTEPRKSWQHQAIKFCHGNQSQLGAFIIAMLGRNRNAPCFLPAGRTLFIDGVGMDCGLHITMDGRVLVIYLPPSGEPRIENIWAVKEMVNIFRGLARKLKLKDAEIVEMFDELRKFIYKDDRAVSVQP